MADSADPVVAPPDDPRRDSERIHFVPQVGPPIARLRPAFVLALVATLAFALGALAWGRWLRPAPAARVIALAGMRLPRGCTALEAEEILRASKMTDIERATCLAVAGRIDRARELLSAMSAARRSETIGQVFNLAHPIADRGDDASAGPIMALVVEFWPDNYMAVFHAGMAEFALGHDDLAGAQLERFLTMYAPRDVWRQRAEQALAAIATHTELDKRKAHFPE